MEFKANCTAVEVIELFKMNVYFLNPVQWKKKKNQQDQEQWKNDRGFSLGK